MTPYEQVHSGKIYNPEDKAIMEEQARCKEKVYDYNATRPSEEAKRAEMLKDIFAEVGENCYIEQPFYANFGGKTCTFRKTGLCEFSSDISR